MPRKTALMQIAPDGGHQVDNPDVIAEVVFDVRKESNPCSLCSKMRKGSLNEAYANFYIN